jgi:hypothetical protein
VADEEGFEPFVGEVASRVSASWRSEGGGVGAGERVDLGEVEDVSDAEAGAACAPQARPEHFEGVRILAHW